MEKSTYNPDSIVIKHQSGSKAGQNEIVSLKDKKEIQIGRSNTADITYDPVADILVSRQHAKITQDSQDAARFTITDLNSSNGVLVNGTKIHQAQALNHGDKVALGAGGPSFEFALNPAPPTAAAGKTQVVQTLEEDKPATKVISSSEFGGTGTPTGASGKVLMGKETTERIIHDAQTKQRTSFLYILGTVLVIAVAVIAFLLMGKPEIQAGPTPDEINRQNRDKVVFIDASWKMTSATGEQVFHKYSEKDGKIYPLYLRIGNSNTIEPYIGFFNDGNDVAIGGGGTATGFLVSSNGYILTNAHVASEWLLPYNFPKGSFPGRFIELRNGKLVIDDNVEITDIPDWIPAKAKLYGDNEVQDSKVLQGSHTRLEVTFAKDIEAMSSSRDDVKKVNAQLVTSDAKHDLALISIGSSSSLPSVELLEDDNSVQVSDKVMAFGYPASARIDGNPILLYSEGIVSSLPTNETSNFMYTLSNINVGYGSSGGPLFNEQGKVIGIITAGRMATDLKLVYAVPIKYGKDLLE